MAEIIDLAARAMMQELEGRIRILESALSAAVQGAFLHAPDYQTVIDHDVYQFFGFPDGVLEVRIVTDGDRKRTHLTVMTLDVARKVQPTSQYAMHLKDAVTAIERHQRAQSSAA